MAPNSSSVELQNESPQEPLTFDLDSLPNELLESIFKHVTLRTFKSLRLVSQRFRQLASTKEALDNFALVLRSKRVRLVPELLVTLQTLPATHLRLDQYEANDLNPGSPFLRNLDKLAGALGERLRSLEIVGGPCRTPLSVANGHLVLLPFLHRCGGCLESVGVIRLKWLERNILQELEGKDVRFPSMRELRVAIDMDSEYQGDALLRMLDRCRGLMKLELVFADQEEHPMTPESFTSSVLSPILSYLDSFPERKPRFTVKFTTEGQKASIPLTFTSLQELLLRSKSGAEDPEGHSLFLENVPFLALPTKRNLASHPEVLERLNFTVKSIIGTTRDLKLSTMEIERDSFHLSCRHFMPPSAKFSIIISLPCNNKIYLTCPAQLLPQNIHSITIISENTKASLLLSINDDEDNKSFIQDLLNSRPGLEELKILAAEDQKMQLPFLTQDSENFKGFGSFKNFPNLKILHLDCWGKVDSDFWELWENLGRLEELVLRKCYRLKDESLMGKKGGDGKSLGDLEKLRHLVIAGFWTVSDTSFVNVFSKLRLNYLEVWDDPDKNEKSLTIKSLISLHHGPCGESLQSLKVNKPFKCSQSDVKKALIPCRSLKRVELLEEAGAGSKMVMNLITF